MEKDPAFLFYSEKFISGIITMTFEDRGKYITLLALMHQNGRMNEETIRFLVGSISDNLRSKFRIDENGMWYNEKLEKEVEKRRKFAETRRENGKKGGRKPNAKPIGYDYENLPINKDINTNIDSDLITDSFGKSENLLNGDAIIPTLCRIWYQKFPTYTKDQESDFKAAGSILSFMVRQHAIIDFNAQESREKITSTVEQIAAEVAKEPFWVNKPLKSIANNIQEFYNRIKNPVNGKTSKQPNNLEFEVQEEFNRRFGN